MVILPELRSDGDLLKLHLGCGSKYLPGWINIDKYELSDDDHHRGQYIKPDLWHDINRLDEVFQPGTVDIIYSSHVIEHFYPFETIKNLFVFKRLLKKGGVIIIETPDLGRVKILDFLYSACIPGIMARSELLKARKSLIRQMHNMENALELSRLLLKYTQTTKSKISSQYYGASWEANELGYPYHKYVWTRYELQEVFHVIGFRRYISTSSTISHQPLRDMLLAYVNTDGDNGFALSTPATDFTYSFVGSLLRRRLRQLKAFIVLLLFPWR